MGQHVRLFPTGAQTEKVTAADSRSPAVTAPRLLIGQHVLLTPSSISPRLAVTLASG